MNRLNPVSATEMKSNNSLSEQHHPDISVVIPLFNEEQIIPELISRVNNALQDITPRHEIIYVNDGSSDNTLSELKSFITGHNNIKYISFSRNFGHQNAIMSGINNATGKTVVIMDGDLQDPPEIIAALYAKLNQGYHVVYAKRKDRKGESYFKKITAKAFYRLLKKLTAVDIPLDTGDFRIMSRKVVDELKRMDEKNKFLRGQIAWLGFSQSFIEYDRPERFTGSTKFTLRKMVRFAMDGVTSFSNFPLQVATFLGFTFSFVAFLIILYALFSKFILLQAVTGWTSLMISTMFIGGIQLLCIGMIGEYISRISVDVKNRPSYIIEETNIGQVQSPTKSNNNQIL